MLLKVVLDPQASYLIWGSSYLEWYVCKFQGGVECLVHFVIFPDDLLTIFILDIQPYEVCQKWSCILSTGFPFDRAFFEFRNQWVDYVVVLSLLLLLRCPLMGGLLNCFGGLSFGVLSLKRQLCHLRCREEVVLVLKKWVLFEGCFF